MPFVFNNTPGQYNPANTLATVDASIISKLQDAGYQLTPVGAGVDNLRNTQGARKELLPGASVPGYQDSSGNFYVVDERNTIHDVRTLPVPPTMGIPDGPTRPPISNPLPPSPGPISPTPPQGPPPGGTIGSGKIYSRFESGDIIPNQQETVTRALWSNNVGNLLTFYTSSAQTATQKRYYYEIFNSASTACGAEAQFSVAYGHRLGSGSADEGGQVNDTPSRAIYGQYRGLCLDGDTKKFVIDGSSTDHIYVINVNRARMREYLDEGNIEVNIAHLSGSQYVAGGNANDTHTGSAVKLAGNSRVIRLIDDSKINSATVGTSGEVYNMVSGSIEDGVYNSSNPHIYGLMYRRLGIIVFDANKLNLSASFATVTGSEVAGDNAFKLYTAMSGAALFTDASGDRLGFQGRSAEKVKSTYYFCRIKNSEYNFSNNPTFITGSEGDLAQPTFINDPKVYITTVGLYTPRKELVAIAKISKALKKSFTKEALVQVKLDFVWVIGMMSFLGMAL